MCCPFPSALGALCKQPHLAWHAQGLIVALPRKDLCPSFSCLHHLLFLTDGVFGRCQKVPARDTYRYEVSPVVLQHLRVTLQKLSRTGRTGVGPRTEVVSRTNEDFVCFKHPRAFYVG